jgi:hypothetical protein
MRDGRKRAGEQQPEGLADDMITRSPAADQRRRLPRSPQTGHVPRESRLRALSQLLEYLLEETKDLGVAELDKLLAAAAMAINDEVGAAKIESSYERPLSK